MPFLAVQLVSGMQLALIQTPTPRVAWWASTLADIATIVIAVALIIVAVALVPGMFSAGKIYRRLDRLIERLHDDTTPILLHARDIADNLNYISASIRTDVEELKTTMRSTQRSLTEAAEGTERRINEFNALLEVVQEEAERLFIDTASTIRGVKIGADALHRPRPTRWIETLDEDPAPRRRRREPEEL